MAVCEQSRDSLDENTSNIVTKVGVKRSAKVTATTETNSSTAVVPDSIQKDNCTIADAVEVWETLKTIYPWKNREARSRKKIQKRYDPALSPSHFLDSIIHY